MRAAYKGQVPEPYPGIQHDLLRDLKDWYTRYAKHGTVVWGHSEDDGQWLRLAQGVFLPMRVGDVQILKAVDADGDRVSTPSADGTANEAGRGGARTTGKADGVVNLPWCGACDPSESPARFASPDPEVLVHDESGQQVLLRNNYEPESEGTP